MTKRKMRMMTRAERRALGAVFLALVTFGLVAIHIVVALLKPDMIELRVSLVVIAIAYTAAAAVLAFGDYRVEVDA